MSDKERAALDFSCDPGAADIALAEPSRPFPLQVISGSGVAGTKKLSTTRARAARKAPDQWSAALSANTLGGPDNVGRRRQWCGLASSQHLHKPVFDHRTTSFPIEDYLVSATIEAVKP